MSALKFNLILHHVRRHLMCSMGVAGFRKVVVPFVLLNQLWELDELDQPAPVVIHIHLYRLCAARSFDYTNDGSRLRKGHRREEDEYSYT